MVALDEKKKGKSTCCGGRYPGWASFAASSIWLVGLSGLFIRELVRAFSCALSTKCMRHADNMPIISHADDLAYFDELSKARHNTTMQHADNMSIISHTDYLAYFDELSKARHTRVTYFTPGVKASKQSSKRHQ